MDLVKQTSTALIIRGCLTVVFGIIAMAWPISTVITLVVVWGVYAIVDGVMALVVGFSNDVGAGHRAWAIVSAVLAFVAGFIVIVRPIEGAVTLTWVLGIWLIVRGIFDLVAVVGSDLPTPKWLLVVSGIASILAGLVIAARPGSAALGLTLWLGVLAVVWGAGIIGAGIARRARAAHLT